MKVELPIPSTGLPCPAASRPDGRARPPSRARLRSLFLASTTLAGALSGATDADAQQCTGNLVRGCIHPGAVCSPVDIGDGDKGHCRSSGPLHERECNCVGAPPPPPPPPPHPTLLPEALTTINTSSQDGGFFTSVSSNGTTPGSAIIWAVGRIQGADNHVTLYAFDPGANATNLRLLWSGVAGLWPNTGGNAYLVPTVANGRVYVGSNKQVRIFGVSPLKNLPPPLAESAPAQPSSPPGAAITAETPAVKAQYWGTVTSMDADSLVIQLRTGRLVTVDLAAANRNGQVTPVVVGAAVVVAGSLDASGTIKAQSVLRAKGSALWGEDVER